jgi:hypothetical protein
VNQVCGLTDPFCGHASGAKYPDDTSLRSLPYTVHYNTTVGSDANGNLGLLVWPTWFYSSFVGGAVNVGGDTFTPSLNFSVPVVPVLTGQSKARIVSMGIRVRNVAPALTASGMVYLRSFPAELAASLVTIQGTSYMASQSKDVPLIECRDEAVVFEHSSQMPQIFYDGNLQHPTPAVVTAVASGFLPVTIMGNGLPASTPCLQVELVMHMEYLFQDNAALALAATPPPTSNALVTSVAAKITSAGEATFHAGVESLSRWVQAKAIGYLAKNLPGPARPLGMAYSALTVD